MSQVEADCVGRACTASWQLHCNLPYHGEASRFHRIKRMDAPSAAEFSDMSALEIEIIRDAGVAGERSLARHARSRWADVDLP